MCVFLPHVFVLFVCVVRFVLGRTARLDVVVCVAVCVVVAACGRRAIGIVDHDLSRCVNSYPPQDITPTCLFVPLILCLSSSCSFADPTLFISLGFLCVVF